MRFMRHRKVEKYCYLAPIHKVRSLWAGSYRSVFPRLLFRQFELAGYRIFDFWFLRGAAAAANRLCARDPFLNPLLFTVLWLPVQSHGRSPTPSLFHSTEQPTTYLLVSPRCGRRLGTVLFENISQGSLRSTTSRVQPWLGGVGNVEIVGVALFRRRTGILPDKT
jgi:hypothetical protein